MSSLLGCDQEYLCRAVELAVVSAARDGFPCGALVVVDGAVVGEGKSSSLVTPDPVAHAEVNAIRAAAFKQGTGRLTGATLYSALEPCLMCLHAAYWAGIARIVYAVPKAHIQPEYYEGSGTLPAAAAVLSRELRIECLTGFGGELLGLIRDWERRHAVYPSLVEKN